MSIMPIKIYGPSYLMLSFIFIGGLTILIAAFMHFDSGAVTSKNAEALIGVFTGAVLIIVSVFAYLSAYPKIVLTSSGIETYSLLKRKMYRWCDIGVFEARTLRFGWLKYRYLCAYSDINHDILSSGSRARSVSVHDADVSLLVNIYAAGRRDDLVKEMAREFNEWRLKYGAPENNGSNLTEGSKNALRFKKQRQKRRSIILLVVGFVFYIFVKANS